MNKTFIAAVSALLLSVGTAQAADVKIGYQLTYTPWKAMMGLSNLMSGNWDLS